MAEAIGLAPAGANLFLITPVESIMRSAERLGFTSVTTETQPHLLGWASEVDIVTRLPGSISPIAPGVWGKPRGGERWLFMRG